MGARRGTIGILLAATAVVGGAVQVVRAVDGDDPPIAGPAVAAAPAVRIPSPARTFTVVAAGDILTENAVLSAAAARRLPASSTTSPPCSLRSRRTCGGGPGDLPHGAAHRPAREPPANLGRSAFGGNRLRGPYEMVVGVAATGFDRCSTASNHSNDTGTEGIVSTLDALDAVGLTHDGTARTPDEALPTASIITVNGVRVAHLSYTRFSNTGATAAAWELAAVTDPAAIADDVKAVRGAGAEVVIVSIHLGAEMSTAPTAGDRAFVEWLTAEVPIDLVIHHGPHVIQPVERVERHGGVLERRQPDLGHGGGGLRQVRRPAHARRSAGDARFPRDAAGAVQRGADAGARLPRSQRHACVWPAAALADPATPAEIRAVLTGCLERSQAVVADLA